MVETAPVLENVVVDPKPSSPESKLVDPKVEVVPQPEPESPMEEVSRDVVPNPQNPRFVVPGVEVEVPKFNKAKAQGSRMVVPALPEKPVVVVVPKSEAPKEEVDRPDIPVVSNPVVPPVLPEKPVLPKFVMVLPKLEVPKEEASNEVVPNEVVVPRLPNP